MNTEWKRDFYLITIIKLIQFEHLDSLLCADSRDGRAGQEEDEEAAPEEEAQSGPAEDGGRAGREPHTSTATRSVHFLYTYFIGFSRSRKSQS